METYMKEILKIILNIKNIKKNNDDEIVSKFRKEFNLNENDYDNKRILEALKIANNDFNKAFKSLFQ